MFLSKCMFNLKHQCEYFGISIGCSLLDQPIHNHFPSRFVNTKYSKTFNMISGCFNAHLHAFFFIQNFYKLNLASAQRDCTEFLSDALIVFQNGAMGVAVDVQRMKGLAVVNYIITLLIFFLLSILFMHYGKEFLN